MKRTTRFLSLLLVCTMLAALCTVTAQAAQVTGSDNHSFASAQRFAPGDSIRGTLSQKEVVDFYSFTLTEGGEFSFSVTSYLERFSLLVYDAEGTSFWHDDDNGADAGLGFCRRNYSLFLSPGTYYVQFRGSYWYNGASIYLGNYQIDTSFVSANATEVEPNNSAAEANQFLLGSTVRGVVAEGHDFDLYQFTLTGGGKVGFDVASYLEQFSILVYDSQANRIWSDDNNGIDSSIGFCRRNYALYLAPGTYYMQFRGSFWYNGASDYSGNYIIGTSFVPANETETEPNNSIAQANPVELGDDLRGIIAQNGDFDLYRFTMPKAEKLSLHIVSYLPQYSLIVRNAAGDSVWSDDNNARNEATGSREDTYSIDLSAGVFYLEVRGSFWWNGASDYPGFYTVSLGSGAGPIVNAPFSDVPDGAYYADPVKWAVRQSITQGTSATTFSPNNACTRAQTVTFLWRAAGSPAPNSTNNPFSDVSRGAYYYDAVLWAVERGITSGTSATTFQPNATVTRAQTVTFLYRAAGAPSAQGGSFADVKDGAYYAPAVAWAVQNRITSGTGAATFSPNSPCTRGQIVTFLYRYYN